MSLSVLHVTQPTTDGVGHHVRAAVAEQAARGWTVTVASPVDEAFREHCAVLGVAWVAWEATRASSSAILGEVRSLRRVVAAIDPDVVHLHSSKAGLAGRLAVRGRRPTLFSPHAWSFLHGGAWTRALALRWERFGARWSTLVVCVSEAERDLGRARSIRAEMVVLHNAVDLDRFTPLSATARDAVRAGVEIGDEPLAVCVGRLARQKGQDVLLDAWPAVRSGVADARLLLAGDGPDRDALAQRCVPGVQLLGVRDDVAALLGAADVVVLPSRWEGASYVLLEAMACGVSVVATDVPGTRESLPGNAGAIVPVDDPRALSVAIIRRLDDRALARVEGARARTAAHAFDVRRWGDALASLTTAAVRAR